MSLSCSQSKFMMLNQHIWSIFNLQQQIVWSRLIIFSMVVGKLCSKEHSTRTVRKKLQISTLEKQIVSFLACLMEQLRETKKQNKKRKKINTCKEKWPNCGTSPLLDKYISSLATFISHPIRSVELNENLCNITWITVVKAHRSYIVLLGFFGYSWFSKINCSSVFNLGWKVGGGGEGR